MLLPWKTGEGNLMVVKSLFGQETGDEFDQKVVDALKIASCSSGLELYPVQMSGADKLLCDQGGNR